MAAPPGGNPRVEGDSATPARPRCAPPRKRRLCGYATVHGTLGFNMAGAPILIVDDTPVNLKLTRILLVNEGYTVLTAASAEEALELLRSYHPRLILADIQLPGMDL